MSVIIPTKERLNLVHRAVRSVLNQTHSDLDIVIVDDSSQESFNQLELAYANLPRIRVMRGSSLGDAAARKFGADIARGPFIAFLDSDDEWLAGHLSAHMSLWARFRAIGLSWNADAVTYHDDRVLVPRVHAFRDSEGLIPREVLSRQLLLRNGIDISSVVTTKDALREVGGFPTQHPCDWRLWVSLSANAAGATTSEILTLHHEDAAGRTGYSQRIRIRDAVNTFVFGLNTLLESNQERSPNFISSWIMERGKDFVAALIPVSCLRGIKALTSYFVESEIGERTPGYASR